MYVIRARKQLLYQYKLTSNGCNVNACAFCLQHNNVLFLLVLVFYERQCNVGKLN